MSSINLRKPISWFPGMAGSEEKEPKDWGERGGWEDRGEMTTIDTAYT